MEKILVYLSFTITLNVVNSFIVNLLFRKKNGKKNIDYASLRAWKMSDILRSYFFGIQRPFCASSDETAS